MQWIHRFSSTSNLILESKKIKHNWIKLKKLEKIGKVGKNCKDCKKFKNTERIHAGIKIVENG